MNQARRRRAGGAQSRRPAGAQAARERAPGNWIADILYIYGNVHVYGTAEVAYSERELGGKWGGGLLSFQSTGAR